MAIEGKWAYIAPVNIINNSPRNGVVLPESTALFKVEMTVVLENTSGSRSFIVTRVDKTSVTLVTSDSKQSIDMSAYNPVNSGKISAPEQTKVSTPEDDQDTDRYEKGPTNADRGVLVDQWGDFYDVTNPVPVQLSDGSINIGTVNAELEVFLTHKDNDPIGGDIHDSVRIGDGENELKVNPDGSLNFVPLNAVVESYYGESLGVVSGITQTLVAFTATDDCLLQKVSFSGGNIAEFELIVDNSTIDKYRTYWCNFNGTFNFTEGNGGMSILAGQVIEVKVYNFRPLPADFNARIQILEI